MSASVEHPAGEEAGPSIAWACPRCHRPLLSEKQDLLTDSLACHSCGLEYPICHLDGEQVPWLFRDPIGAATDWQTRYSGFLAQNRAQRDGLTVALHAGGLTVLNRERLERQLHARTRQEQQISELLKPLGFVPEVEHDAVDLACLGSSLAKNQGMLSYHDNLFRDWSWGTDENAAQLAQVQRLWTADDPIELGHLLVLGSGAGRLTYDVQRLLTPLSTTLLDCNPLHLITSQRLFSGRAVELYEFPVAPLNSNAHAVKQRCCGPTDAASETNVPTRFVFADATNAPFTDHSFQTILTPWLIDVLHCDLADFAAQLNRLLPLGGEWLNTGSLAFAHSNQRWCYSEEETVELIEQHGFELISCRRDRIPYLQSPHSAHHRVESVFSFRAKKVAERSKGSSSPYVPQWATQLDHPVPQSGSIKDAAAQHLLVAQVLAAVDGSRSVEDVSKLVAQQYQLNQSAAAAAVRKILLDFASDRVG